MKQIFTPLNIYKKQNFVIKVIIFILCVLLCVSVYNNFYSINYQLRIRNYDNYLKQYETLKNTKGIDYLTTINEDFVAWLTCEDLSISLPIVKTDSKNEENFYLDHDFEKRNNPLGSPYKRYGCDFETSNNAVLVGHSAYSQTTFNDSKVQNIFGKFNNYLLHLSSYNYEIKLQTLTENLTYKVVSVFQFNVKENYNKEYSIYNTFNFSSQSVFNNFYSNLQELSFYDFEETADINNKFLTIFTCAKNLDYRVIVVAKLV